MTPELTYGDIALLMLMLLGSVLVVGIVAYISIHFDSSRVYKWFSTKKRKLLGPPRSVLIAANKSLKENNRLLAQENKVLLAENYRLRMLNAKVK